MTYERDGDDVCLFLDCVSLLRLWTAAIPVQTKKVDANKSFASNPHTHHHASSHPPHNITLFFSCVREEKRKKTAGVRGKALEGEEICIYIRRKF